jgi:hypothetical protein
MNLTPDLLEVAAERIPHAQYPGVLADVVRVAGPQVALTLVAYWGGSRRYIPSRMKADHDLVKLLGAKQAQLVAKTIGGDSHAIPLMTPALRHYLALYLVGDCGMSNSAAALKLSTTRERISSITRNLHTEHQVAAHRVRSGAIQRCPTCRRTLRHVIRARQAAPSGQGDLFEGI